MDVCKVLPYLCLGFIHATLLKYAAGVSRIYKSVSCKSSDVFSYKYNLPELILFLRVGRIFQRKIGGYFYFSYSTCLYLYDDFQVFCLFF